MRPGWVALAITTIREFLILAVWKSEAWGVTGLIEFNVDVLNMTCM